MCEMAESRRICGILPVWLQDLQEEGELLWRSGGVKVGMGVECSDQQEQGVRESQVHGTLDPGQKVSQHRGASEGWVPKSYPGEP